MKRIYIDVDDVVARTTETYTKIAKEAFGREVAFEDLACFDLRVSFNLTDKEFSRFFDLVHQPELLLSFSQVDGAKDTISEWKERGHVIEIVTGRPTSAREATLDWLKAQGIPFDDFIMVDKYSRPGNDPLLAITRDALAKRPYDLAVEDSGEMALFLAATMGVTTALIRRPWNRSCPAHQNLLPCPDWQEVRRLAEPILEPGVSPQP